MDIIQVIMGAAMLLFGRKLFWLLVGVAGFLAASHLGALAFAGQPQWLVLLVALATGLLGIVVALFFERLAFAVAGFFIGAYLTATIVAAMGILQEPLVSLVGGVFGAVVAAVIMDWAIVWFSSIAGAGAILSSFALSPLLRLGLWIGLSLVGLLFQARDLRGQKIHSPGRPPHRPDQP